MTTATTPLDAIEKTLELQHPIDRVWRAVTEPEELAAWFPNTGATLDVRPGGEGRFVWVFASEDGGSQRHESEIRVHEVEAPHRFVWSWKGASDPDAVETTVEFRLAARADGGTTLLVRETGFLDSDHRAGNVQGWDGETAELVAYLDAEVA